MNGFLWKNKRKIGMALSGALAALSCLLVPRGAGILRALDTGFLPLLFGYLLLQAALRDSGLLRSASLCLLRRVKTVRGLCLLLLVLSFLSSLFFGEAAPLFSLIPFSILLLSALPDSRALLIHILVLETIAASLGGMLLPFGNVQSLYLTQSHAVSLLPFLRLMLPYVLPGCLLLFFFFVTFPIKGAEFRIEEEGRGEGTKPFRLFLLFSLYLLLFLSAGRLLAPEVALVPMLFLGLLYDRGILRRIDYPLLLSLSFLLILSGNLAGSELLRGWLFRILKGRECALSIVFSQFIGSAPCALLFSPFALNGGRLITGCNIGSLGIFLSSLPALISIRLYLRVREGNVRGFLIHFLWIRLHFMLVFCFLAFFRRSI